MTRIRAISFPISRTQAGPSAADDDDDPAEPEDVRAYRAAFPDMRHQTQDSVSNNEKIALEIRVEGTHKGPMQTPRGTVPATGNRVVWESCHYIRIKNGRLVSWHVYHDPMPFLVALGQLRLPFA